MRAMLSPSKLLPATILATAVALGIKAVMLVALAPSPDALWAGTIQALQLAGNARMIGEARAAQTQATGNRSPLDMPQAGNVAPELPSVPQPQPVPQAVTQPVPQPVPQQAPAGVSTDNAQAIELGRSQIDERERLLTEREATVAAADKHLTDRVAELLIIQTHLELLESDRKAHEEANWSGLVKLYEGMRPRDAAAIFNALDKPVLLEIVDRMKSAKASPVIALMEPESARQVTADLAAKRTRSTTVTN
jgi:flagellar motility protein MotE (MotC chaperone)